MKLRSTRLIVAVAAMAAVWLVCAGAPQAAAQQAPTTGKMSDEVFKNVQALKGITVDDFLGTMGVMSAAIGYDCSECHIGAGTDTVNWAADNPKKNTARRMTFMVEKINKDSFGGRPMVSCWTCHRGRDHPATTPPMEFIYGPGPQDMDDVLTQMPGQPPATEIVDKYLNAIGGAQKLSSVKSYIATGSSVGFGGFGGGGHVHIYAKAPDHRTTLIEFGKSTGRPDSIRTYNGTVGWIKAPLTVLGEYELYGGELAGARVDAELSFPAQIKTFLTNLRTSLPTTISDLPGPSSQTAEETKEGIGKDRVVNVVQGTAPDRTLVTMYFDQDIGAAAARGSHGAFTDRPGSHSDGLVRLSRGQRYQDAVPADVRLAGWARRDPVERRQAQRSDRRQDVREPGIGDGRAQSNSVLLTRALDLSEGRCYNLEIPVWLSPECRAGVCLGGGASVTIQFFRLAGRYALEHLAARIAVGLSDHRVGPRAVPVPLSRPGFDVRSASHRPVAANMPVSKVYRLLMPWTQVGFAVMVVSGLFLFFGIPLRTYENIFFRIKAVLLVLAGLNALVFHKGAYSTVAAWDNDPVPPVPRPDGWLRVDGFLGVHRCRGTIDRLQLVR